MSHDPTKIEARFDPEQVTMEGWTSHGGKHFKAPIISEIDEQRINHNGSGSGPFGKWLFPLFQGGCQNGLILPNQIKHVVSLYKWEQFTVKHSLLSTTTVEMFDSEDQGFEQVDALANWVNVCRKTGPVLVHCQAGLNRSSLVAARSLMFLGETAEDAIAQIRAARSEVCLCNPSFENWLRNV